MINDLKKDLNSNLFGNPHSDSPSSLLSTDRIEAARTEALKFFKADPEHFDLIFVANATAAIKMVMDGMRGSVQGDQTTSFWYGYHADSHTSLIGVREAATQGSKCFRSDDEVERWLSGEMHARSSLLGQNKGGASIGLFAYPAQSNMNGRRLPLTWPGKLRVSPHEQHQNVYSLLDAAAFASTAQLDLSDWESAPDFTALSFYKIFGYPDLGALLVRKRASHILRRRSYFGGGTVDMVINAVNQPEEAWHATKEGAIHEALEDGTPAFHNIIALTSAFKIHRRIFGSMELVSMHTSKLAGILYERLSSLEHANGVPLCVIYKDSTSKYGDGKTQGPTVAFNLQGSLGNWIGKSIVEELAIANNIQIRTGGVCNPGGIAGFLGLTPSEMRRNYAEGLRCGNGLDEIDAKPTGIVRVSLGAMSSMADIDMLIRFMDLFIDTTVPSPRVLISSTLEPKPCPEAIVRASEYNEVLDASSLSNLLQNQEQEKSVCPVAVCKIAFSNRSDLTNHFSRQHIPRSSKPKVLERLFCGLLAR